MKGRDQKDTEFNVKINSEKCAIPPSDRNTARLIIVFVPNNYQDVRDHMRRRIDKGDGRYGDELNNNAVVCRLPMEEL
ncbi:hypothetical protein ACTXT7_007675 [Hymenolepis weldensis]